jgi:2-oxoglutarate ferredoxin oxidoreductase subunit alpha
MGDPHRELSLVLAGEAGQGIQTIEGILTAVFRQAGFHVFATKEYMSRVRGGTNTTQIIIAGHPVDAPLDRIDLLVPLGRGALPWVGERLGPGTAVLADPAMLGGESLPPGLPLIEVPLSQLAAGSGGAIYVGVVAAGVLAALAGVPRDVIDGYLRRRFGAKGEAVVAGNLAAAARGDEAGRAVRASGKFPVDIPRLDEGDRPLFLTGGEAVSMGALAGGCDFVSSYPMSPATTVLTFLAGEAGESGLVVEQAEDEIAAVNMVLGAWYAGARGMVTTSGGGFALMVEGLALAGMLESPLVVHLAQRPGPATGLPTRTGQEDLLFALFAGHGEFPRAILAPGSIDEAWRLTRHAFDLADRCQVPVLVLTDQHLIDTGYTVASLPAGDPPGGRHIVRTAADYRRYAWGGGHLSPRGIPGFGDGLVVVDSDEHDQEGHITESRDVRSRMVAKRLGKLALLREAALPPLFHGDPDGRTLVVGWGSTLPALRRAVANLPGKGLRGMHVCQPYPLHPDVVRALAGAERVIVAEQNATGQLRRLMIMETGLPLDDPGIGAWHGHPFTADGLTASLGELLR